MKLREDQEASAIQDLSQFGFDLALVLLGVGYLPIRCLQMLRRHQLRLLWKLRRYLLPGELSRQEQEWCRQMRNQVRKQRLG